MVSTIYQPPKTVLMSIFQPKLQHAMNYCKSIIFRVGLLFAHFAQNIIARTFNPREIQTQINHVMSNENKQGNWIQITVYRISWVIGPYWAVNNNLGYARFLLVKPEVGSRIFQCTYLEGYLKPTSRLLLDRLQFTCN